MDNKNNEKKEYLLTDEDLKEISGGTSSKTPGISCPICGKNLVIDYRGAGLQINCSQCGESVLVPIPDGMQLTDLDLDPGEILKQLFATRRNYQKAEMQIQSLKAKLTQMQETFIALQEVVAEGLAE